MPSNTETLRQIEDPAKRADFVLSTLSSGGEIQPQAAKKFIQLALNATPLLSQCNQFDMPAKEFHVPRMVFAGPILRAETSERTEVSSGNRAAPTTSEVVLSAKEYDGEVNLTYKVLQDNVEAEALENTILTMIAQRVGVDLETLALVSDTTISDSGLVARGYAQQDGWLKLITSNVVNASSAHVNKAILEQARASVPLKYRQQRMNQYKYFVEEHAGNKWRESISDRMTPGGDAALVNAELPRVGGTAIEMVGNMPVTTGSPDLSTAIFTDPKNLYMGMWRKVSIRAQDWPSLKCVRIFVTVRVGFAVEQEFAAAKITNVRATAN
jgi:Phage capsid family